MNKQGHFRFGIGIISIFMVFVVLCFTILSCLSYMKAADDDERIKQQEAYVKAYYQADGEARAIQQKVEKLAGDFESERAVNVLKDNHVTQQGDQLLYQITINQKQKLSVTLRVDGQKLQVISWKTISGEEATK